MKPTAWICPKCKCDYPVTGIKNKAPDDINGTCFDCGIAFIPVFSLEAIEGLLKEKSTTLYQMVYGPGPKDSYNENRKAWIACYDALLTQLKESKHEES